MYTGRTKKFRDTIHGYIEIPEVIVSNIIDTELFQRLRNIEQTSMRSLYPAARHDRFIHSLGVYQLGKQAFKNFRKNAEIELNGSESELEEIWWDKQEILFSLACLLHDCAHAPFSHTLEDLYVLHKVKIGTKEYIDSFGLEQGTKVPELDYRLMSVCAPIDNQFAQDFFSSKRAALEVKGIGAPHEKMSAYCVVREYKEPVKRILKELMQCTDEEVFQDEDIVFMVRMIIGCAYTKSGIEHSIKNCIISMLNSSSIDVDGLDYIVRDAYMSGIDNFSIDYQRLLGSFTIIPIEICVEQECKNKDISGIWLKGSKFEIKRLNTEITGKLVIEGMDDNENESIAIKSKSEDIHLEKGICSTKTESIIRISNLRSGTMQLLESCNLKTEAFSGVIKEGRRIASSFAQEQITNGYREYILGYDKRSLSIIQSTMDARNHEYLWIYTHPKVLYSSNYLQWELLRDSAKYLCCCANKQEFSGIDYNCKNCQIIEKNRNIEEYLLHILGDQTYFTDDKFINESRLGKKQYNELEKKGFIFYRTCDNDLNALFKRIYVENACCDESRKSTKLERDFREFFSRKHRKAIWKSFIEYDNFLKANDKDGAMRSILPKFCKRVVSQESIYKNKYGEPNEAAQKIFDAYGMKNVLIIKSEIKTKELNPTETFIKFKNQILRLEDIFNESRRKVTMSKEFYYIFADIENELQREDYINMVNELDGI